MKSLLGNFCKHLAIFFWSHWLWQKEVFAHIKLMQNIAFSIEDILYTYFLKKSFIFNFLFHISHDKFDRQIIVSNQINLLESWINRRCCAWVQKRVCCHRGWISHPRTWRSVPMIRAKCDTTQLWSNVGYTYFNTNHLFKVYDIYYSCLFCTP